MYSDYQIKFGKRAITGFQDRCFAIVLPRLQGSLLQIQEHDSDNP